MKLILQCSRHLLFVGFGALFACSEFETAYFQSKVDQVTQDAVARRYGPPHKIDKLPEGRSVWTYFDRGSSTIGYGYALAPMCNAYLLTFDQPGVLRDWNQQDCSSQPKLPNGSSSDHN
jgi:hypothetical protein